MEKIIIRILTVLLVTISFTTLWAEETKLTATQILEKADDVINAPKDQDLKISLILIDKNGDEKKT